jgi:hypothetical protein
VKEAPKALASSSSPAAPEAKSGGERRHNILGLALDLGVPDFGAVTVLYRPFSFLRFGGGILYDYLGFGARGSVSVLPYFPIAPSLNLEVGHYFDTDASKKIGQFVTLDDKTRPLLEQFGYTFVNAQLGLELGHPDHFVFFIRAGLTRLWLTAHGVSQAVQSASSSSTGQTTMTSQDPNARVQFPSAKLGFIVYFY